MISQRILPGLLIGLAAAATVSAQSNPALRWREGAAPLGLQVQLGQAEDSAAWRIARAKGPSVKVIGKTEAAPDLGFYGRVGTVTSRSLSAPAADGGLTYGVGLSWDFSKRASASIGWDNYDLRTPTGEARDVRATSLGLQWRY
jgi:OmpA-OmpF porin, OOP family